MPKEHSSRPLNPPRASPYSRRPDLMTQERYTVADIKEWEEARCPICIEHPHNAVLLKCSSHEKGCRPYICDTSHRLSNCLNQFKRSFGASSPLQCPLCRGHVTNWAAIGPARQVMDSMPRACPCEGCDFAGTYHELRAHARALHPEARPSRADPERERAWARMEEARALDDLTSINERDRDELLLILRDLGQAIDYVISGSVRTVVQESHLYDTTRSDDRNPGTWRGDDFSFHPGPRRIDDVVNHPGPRRSDRMLRPVRNRGDDVSSPGPRRSDRVMRTSRRRRRNYTGDGDDTRFDGMMRTTSDDPRSRLGIMPETYPTSSSTVSLSLVWSQFPSQY